MIGFGVVRLALVAALFLVTGRSVSAKPLEVVASFTILADMIHQVGGERVHVISLVGPGADPHEFEPTPEDAKRLKNADLVFLNGLDLETWFGRLAKAAGFSGTPVVTSAGIRTRKMEEDGKQVIDPHAWNSVVNGQIYARNIMNALSKADPDGANIYQQNGTAYIEALAQLDVYAHQHLDAIPKSRRKVLTTHDAIGYLAAAYGIQILSPLGLSTQNEPSAGEIAKVIRQIRAEHVRTYFFENASDSRLVKQVAAATGAQPGGELYVEALSPPDGPAATYAKLFKHNVDRLAAAMQAEPKT